MKKIIAAFDGLKYSTSTRDYAIMLAKLNNAHLVGVFLDDPTSTSYKIYDLIDGKGSIDELKKKFDKKDTRTRETSLNDFDLACKKAGLEYTIHRDRKIAIQDLLHESIYADLIVIDARETLSPYKEKTPTSFIRDLLSDVQCPVLVVPHFFKSPDKLILLYDGAPSSVHAIKMFSHTLMQLKTLPVEVVSINSLQNTLHVPDNKLMKEFMKRHFPKATYKVLKGYPDIEIVNYLKSQKGTPLVVLGAYRRSRVSRWFRESMADALMKEIRLPLFIAHNK